MNLDDFRCMRRGRFLSMVSPQNAPLLENVNIRNGKKHKALLMLHGFASTPAVFRYMIPQLQGYDAIIAPKLPGHGVCLDEFSRMKGADLTAFVLQLGRELCDEFEQVDVLGLSMGGLLTSYLGQHLPLHHQYLLAPAIDLHLALDNTMLLARVLHKLGFRRVRYLAGNMRGSDTWEMSFCQMPLTTLVELLGLIKAFQFRAPNCPTDVFLGTYDEVVSSHCVSDRFSKLPDCTVHWLQQSAHLLPLDSDRDQIVRCLNQNNTP